MLYFRIVNNKLTLISKDLKTSLFTLCFVLLLAGLVRGADTFKILLSNNLPIQYCSTAVPIVSPDKLSIETSISIKGMKISFSSGFVPGEDELVYADAVPAISGVWYPTQGYLKLQANGTATPSKTEFIKAIESVVYKNNKGNPTSSTRQVSISLLDADYFATTQHFYRFVRFPGITWHAAKDSAASDRMLYFGLRGYLATITSQEENDFINTKTSSVGWIGASDEAVEGDWRWVTGPEGFEENNQGRLFWRGTGQDAQNNPSVYGPVKDPSGVAYYQNWNIDYSANPPRYEPNNAGNEDYAHITVFPNDKPHSYKWNDLSNTGDTNPTSDYYPAGYLIEYGDMPKDPKDLKLSETIDLQVSPIVFKSGEIPAICEGASVTLNQKDNYTNPIATYLWSPTKGLSDPLSSNPVATPAETTTYTVVGSRGVCNFPYEFKVTVHPKPKVSFDIDPTKCYGYSIDAAYNIPGVDTSNLNFTWVFGGDTIKSGIGISNVVIPLGSDQSPRKVSLNVTDQYGCSNQFIGSDILVKPNLSAWTVNHAEDCLYNQFEFSVTDPGSGALVYDWLFGDGEGATGITSTHRYKITGKYDVQLKVTNNANNCFNSETKKSMVFAEPLPHAEFTMSDSIVYKDQPKVVFTNQSTGASTYEWSFGDYSTPSSETNPIHYYNETGYHIVLLVDHNENLCVDSIKHRVLVAFSRIFPPNAFSPNAPDPKDRIFLPFAEGVRSQGYHLTILSRWDDVIFEVWHQITGWDGKMDNGSFAPPGVYVWRLLYNDFLERPHHQSGTVTLIY